MNLSYLRSKDPSRFAVNDSQRSMQAVVTRGNGGFEQLDIAQVAIPEIGSNDVLLRVLAAGVNNTEINTRLGWYSSSITTSTAEKSEIETDSQKESEQLVDGGWNEGTPFPFIQGTDCCGEIVELGTHVVSLLKGQRVLVRACMREDGYGSLDNIWMASDFDGAFAQYVRVPHSEIFPVNCDWSDAELATIPCAYGTAENMVHRVHIGSGEKVLVTGASGGVGSAVVQLVRRRGAEVVAVAGKEKHDDLRALGVTELYDRNDDLLTEHGENAVDAVFDNVAGEGFTSMLKLLKRGGRYASSGAIAGPMVTMDMRDFYLKDIQLIGCTAWDEPVFGNLVGYIERNEIKPLLATTYPLSQIADAQREFLKKKHFGNIVLIPEH